MGTHLRVLSESSPINTNMTGFRWYSKYICVLVLRTNVATNSPQSVGAFTPA